MGTTPGSGTAPAEPAQRASFLIAIDVSMELDNPSRHEPPVLNSVVARQLEFCKGLHAQARRLCDRRSSRAASPKTSTFARSASHMSTPRPISTAGLALLLEAQRPRSHCDSTCAQAPQAPVVMATGEITDRTHCEYRCAVHRGVRDAHIALRPVGALQTPLCAECFGTIEANRGAYGAAGCIMAPVRGNPRGQLMNPLDSGQGCSRPPHPSRHLRPASRPLLRLLRLAGRGAAPSCCDQHLGTQRAPQPPRPDRPVQSLQGGQCSSPEALFVALHQPCARGTALAIFSMPSGISDPSMTEYPSRM